MSFNFRNKWKKPTATWLKRAFPTIFDCGDNFTPIILFFPWLSVGCYDKFGTGFTVLDCRATVFNTIIHHNTVEPRVWNISFWSCQSNNCTLMVFFSHAFTYIDYPIAVLDLSIYHSVIFTRANWLVRKQTASTIHLHFGEQLYNILIHPLPFHSKHLL